MTAIRKCWCGDTATYRQTIDPCVTPGGYELTVYGAPEWWQDVCAAHVTSSFDPLPTEDTGRTTDTLWCVPCRADRLHTVPARAVGSEWARDTAECLTCKATQDVWISPYGIVTPVVHTCPGCGTYLRHDPDDTGVFGTFHCTGRTTVHVMSDSYDAHIPRGFRWLVGDSGHVELVPQCDTCNGTGIGSDGQFSGCLRCGGSGLAVRS